MHFPKKTALLGGGRSYLNNHDAAPGTHPKLSSGGGYHSSQALRADALAPPYQTDSPIREPRARANPVPNHNRQHADGHSGLTKVRMIVNFVNLPDPSSIGTGSGNSNTMTSRSFLVHLNVDEHSDYVYLQEAVRGRLLELRLPSTSEYDFEIFMHNSTLVVDDTLFSDLLGTALAAAAAQAQKKGAANTPGVSGLAVIGGDASGTPLPAAAVPPAPAAADENALSWHFDVRLRPKVFTSALLARVTAASSSSLDSTLAPSAGHHSGDMQPNQHRQLTTSPPLPSRRPAFETAPLVAVGNLSGALQRGSWRLQARVFRTLPKSNGVAEAELVGIPLLGGGVGGTSSTGAHITLVTYHVNLVERITGLRINACVEIRNAICSDKSPRDIQYQNNAHPAKIIFDTLSEMVVIDDPMPANHHAPVGIPSLGLASPYAGFNPPPPPPMISRTQLGGVVGGGSGGHYAASVAGSYGSSAGLSATHRTVLGSSSAFSSSVASGLSASTAAALSSVPPSHLQHGYAPPSSNASGVRRTMLGGSGGGGGSSQPPTRLGGSTPTTTGPTPLITPAVSARDAAARDTLLALKQAQQALDEERIRKRQRREVSDACYICGFDFFSSDESGRAELARLHQRLKTFYKPGVAMPTLEAVRAALTDQRVLHPDLEHDDQRIFCHRTYVDGSTRQVHRVHARCAHLTSDYQGGTSLPNVMALAPLTVECKLCGQLGATTACVHPDCKDVFHTVCAIFSHGHVNMDSLRDPYLPQPACPRHTNVNDAKGTEGRKDTMYFDWLEPVDSPRRTKGVDSRCIRLDALRDPDRDPEDH